MKASVRTRVSPGLARPITFILLTCLAGFLLLAASSTASAVSDAARRDLDATGASIQPAPVDPAIVAVLNQISARQIRGTIEALVGFKNRSTLSSMDKDLPAGQGASAAADWITERLQSYSGDCGGCMEVKRDTFTEPPQTGPNARITQPTT